MGFVLLVGWSWFGDFKGEMKPFVFDLAHLPPPCVLEAMLLHGFIFVFLCFSAVVCWLSCDAQSWVNLLYVPHPCLTQPDWFAQSSLYWLFLFLILFTSAAASSLRLDIFVVVLLATSLAPPCPHHLLVSIFLHLLCFLILAFLLSDFHVTTASCVSSCFLIASCALLLLLLLYAFMFS